MFYTIHKKMQKIKLLGLTLALAIIIWAGLFSTTASSQQIESRLNNLRADFSRMESRLNQIESQIGITRQYPNSRTSITVPQSTRRNLSPQERDQMFDRLATLVVELKEQVNTLEQRIAKLESR
jgi:outer membrane murein-binding lipoprotein Lpp